MFPTCFCIWSTSRSSDTPTGKGFANSLKLDCTTADTSLGAGHFGLIHYRFEGQHLQLLKKGTSDAEKLTIAYIPIAVLPSTSVAVVNA